MLFSTDIDLEQISAFEQISGNMQKVKKNLIHIYEVKLFTARWLDREMTRQTKNRHFTETPQYKQVQ